MAKAGPVLLRSLVWEEQEAREDIVRALDTHHAIIIVDLQPHLLARCHVEQDPTGGDLLSVGCMVTEGGHFSAALVQGQAQVGCLGCVEDKVIEAWHLAGEFACGQVIVPLRVGDGCVELDQTIGFWVLLGLPCH